jgi:hypothetical protein
MAVAGTLTVNVTAGTSDFKRDIGEATGSIKGFGEVHSSTMHSSVGGVRLLTHELGVPLPRELARLIASMPAVGAAFTTMLPVIGVVAAIAVIAKLIAKSDEAKSKMAESAAAAVHGDTEVFNGLDDKLLEVEKRTDELVGNHLGALRRELTLLDHASLKELEQAFDHFAKDASQRIKDVAGNWYDFALVTSGQGHALQEFKDQYNALLDEGKTKEAADKLAGTLKKATEYLEGLKSKQGTMYGGGALDEQIAKQEILIQALKNQGKAVEEVAAITAGKKGNAQTGEAQAEASRQNAIYEEQQRGLDQRRRAEERYEESRKKLIDKGVKEDIRLKEEEAAATAAVMEACEKVQLELAEEQLRSAIELAQQENQAADEAARHKLAMRKSTIEQEVAAEKDAAKRMYDAEMAGYDQELSALSSAAIKNTVAIQKLNDKKLLAEEKYQEQRNKIANKGEEEYANIVRQAQEKMADATSTAVNKMLFQHKSAAQAFRAMGEDMVENAIKSAIKMMMTNDWMKLSNAEVAASNAMKDYPFPVNIPIAAAVFAATLAFAQGGKVPGYGNADTVPAMLTPGETVVTKALTQQVENSQGGSSNQGHTVHIHMGDVHAVDAKGFDGLLEKHAAVVGKHVQSQMRRMHRKVN